jgi:hypothetical protein
MTHLRVGQSKTEVVQKMNSPYQNQIEEKQVMLTTEKYKQKATNFIYDNHLTILNNNPT